MYEFQTDADEERQAIDDIISQVPKCFWPLEALDCKKILTFGLN